MRVEIDALGDAVSLQSDDGKRIFDGVRYQIKGAFRLHFGKAVSEPVEFGGSRRAYVAPDPDRWGLSSLESRRAVEFKFKEPIVISAGHRSDGRHPCAHLAIKSLYVLTPTGGVTKCRIDLDSFGITLGPEPSTDYGRCLYYPPQSVFNTRRLIGSCRKCAFFFRRHTLRLDSYSNEKRILYRSYGFMRSISLDHVPESHIHLPKDTVLDFHFSLSDANSSSGNDSHNSFSMNASEGDQLDIHVRDNLGLTYRPSQSELLSNQKSTHLPLIAFTKLEAKYGGIYATQFHEKELNLGICNSVDDALDKPLNEQDIVELRGDDRLSFWLPMVTPSVGATDAVPQFIYRDSAVNPMSMSPPPPSLKSRHLGVHLPSVLTTRGAPITLDADLARIRLLRGDLPKNSRFALEAGGAIWNPLDHAERQTRLIPKPAFGGTKQACTGDLTRWVEISTGSLRLHINGHDSGRSPLQLNVDREGFLRVEDPQLRAAPIGTPALPRNKESAEQYRDLILNDKSISFLDFRIACKGLVPVVVDKASSYKWIESFYSNTDSFRLADQPGGAVTFPGIEDVPISTSFKYEERDGEKLPVYKALNVQLHFKNETEPLIYQFEDSGISYQFELGKDEQWANRREPDDFQVILKYNGDGNAQECVSGRIIDFIRQYSESNDPPISDILWSFAPGADVVLYDKASNRYGYLPIKPDCPDHDTKQNHSNEKDRIPLLAVDLSTHHSLIGKASLANTQKDPLKNMKAQKLEQSFEDAIGWDQAKRMEVVRDAIELWPRLSGRTGARLDPSNRFWRGVFIQDWPLRLAGPLGGEAIGSGFPYLVELNKRINQSLVLDYGWKDETGSSFYASIDLPGGKCIDFTPTGYEDFMVARLKEFAVLGNENQILGARGGFSFDLKLINIIDNQKKKTGSLCFGGTFNVTLDDGFEIDRVELDQSGDVTYSTFSIPGFSAFKLTRASTDLRTMDLDFNLVPEEKLRTALFPSLGTGGSIEARATINLGESISTAIDIELPAPIKTRLHDNWSLEINAMQLILPANPSEDAGRTLVLDCRLNLGPGDMVSLLGQIIIMRKDNGSWTFDIKLPEIFGSIGIGGISISAGYGTWGYAAADSTAVDRDALNDTTTKERDIWAFLAIGGTDSIFGSTDRGQHGPNRWKNVGLLVRFGTINGSNFFVGGLYLKQLDFGPANLHKFSLLLAHNADRDPGTNKPGPLANILSSGSSGSGIESKPLRPDDTGPINWLGEGWKFDKRIGTVAAASGAFELHQDLAKAPPIIPDKNLSGVVISSSGMVRCQVTTDLLGIKELRQSFAFAIDLKSNYMYAAIQTGNLEFPPSGSKEFEFSGGMLEFGLGYGENNKQFLVNMGWPSGVSGDSMDRDWSKSIKIHWADAVPINTFWGGFRAIGSKDNFFLGWALRGGWTRSYRSTADIARGELGLAVGGVVGLRYSSQNTSGETSIADMEPIITESQPPLLPAMNPSSDIDFWPTISEVAYIAHQMQVLGNVDLDYTLFADVWGRASASLFGVTIASIDVSGRARFHISGRFDPGDRSLTINSVKATLGLRLCVKIGCHTQCASTEFKLILKEKRPKLLDDELIEADKEIDAIFAAELNSQTESCTQVLEDQQ